MHIMLLCDGVQVMRQLWMAWEHLLGRRYELAQASTKLHFYTDYDVNHNISYPQGLFPFEVSQTACDGHVIMWCGLGVDTYSPESVET